MAESRVARWWAERTPRHRFALLLGMGGIAALGQAPFSLPIFTFVGLALGMLCFARTTRVWQAFWTGIALGTGYFAVALHWIVEPFLVDLARHGWMAPFALVLMAVGMSLFWGWVFALARGAGRSPWLLAVAWAGMELLRAYLFTGFPWAMPSYVLVDGVLGQGAAWVGSHGMNLVMFAALALVVQVRAVSVVGVAVLIAGLWPVSQGTLIAEDAPVVRVIQPNAPQREKWDPDHMQRFFDRAILGTVAGPERPDVIVWPETSVPAPLGRAPNSMAAIASAAQGVPVVLGMNRIDGRRFFNAAVLMGRVGEVADVYDKHHLVPFGEYVPFGDLMARFGIHGMAARDGAGFSAGSGPRLIEIEGVGKALPLICYEVVFPQDVFAVDERPDLLLQITNDAWFGNFSGPFQHLQQARMRAIEMGLPLVRAANTGVSAVIDPRGRVLDFLPLNTHGHLDVALPLQRAATLYSRTGDMPLMVILILLNAAMLGIGIRNRH